MGPGLTYQFALFEKLRDSGKITVEKLGETGRWYKETYKETPASAIVAHTAFESDRNSVWYSTKYFRINLYGEQNKMRIRDLHIFSDKYTDPYEDIVCKENCAVYDTLPLIDGSRYTGKGVVAGGYLKYCDGAEPRFGNMVFEDAGNGTAVVTYGDIVVELQEDSVKITGTKPFVLENRIGIHGDHLPEVKNVTHESIDLTYNGMDYSVVLKAGKVFDKNTFCSEGNVMELVFRV